MGFVTAIKRLFEHEGMRAEQAEKDHEDPKIQLLQVAQKTQEAHREVIDHASMVMAEKTRAEQRLNDALAEHDAMDKTLEAALRQQDEATKAGNASLASDKQQAAQVASGKLSALEAKIAGLRAALDQATEAATQAKKAAEISEQKTREQLDQAAQLQTNLNQAKMKEALDKEFSAMNDSINSNDTGVTLQEVDEKINTRLAKAGAKADLIGTSDEMKLADVQKEALSQQSDDRIAAKRKEMGLDEKTENAPQ